MLRGAVSHLQKATKRFSTISATPTTAMAESGRQILAQNVTPKHYVLQLNTDLETQVFKGTVDVDLVVNEDSDKITVNAVELDIHSASIDKMKAKSIAYDEEMQTAKFTWDTVWKAGQKKTLSLVFDGKLNKNMAGFYHSTYQTKDGKTENMAVTQFEATDCRRAFPCWDEPALKATFDVSLTTSKEFVHLGNMNVKDERIQGSSKTTTFATTPIMSTYLVAWAIGDFEYVESNAFRLPVRTYTIPGYKEQGVYAADLGAKTLAFFEKVFGIEYPLPKMDFLAVPDFSAGAMENWGLVTYRNLALLLDEETTSASGRERVAMVVQHELAHQWFGNLVTMDFWEGLWLNEGFATYMAMFAGNAFYPEWKLLEAFVATDLQSGLRLDSLRNSHPIEVPVKRADEINQIFDEISYSKGCCVLTMLAKYLGEDVFLKGVSNYLKKHAYSNTKTDDLWKALSGASGKDVVRLMQTWTKKIGYPVVTATEKADALSVRQNRFLSAGDATKEEDQTLYLVPLGLKTKGKNGAVVLEDDLEGRESTIQLGQDKMESFKLNADQYGFYRTCYTPERLEKIGKQAAESADFFSVQDRTGLVADAGALAAAGYGKTSGFLALIQEWKLEDAYL